jgi:acyl carrier protein
MELKDFIRHFSDQFENTDYSEFTAQTRFHDLDEWSSLITLSVIGMVNEEYGVTLTGDTMRNANTIQELYDTVRSQL